MPSLNLIHSPVDIEARKKLDFRAGDTIRVTQKVRESDPSRKGGAEAGKTRLQAFEGMVLARKHGHEPGATFTMRKVLDGVGVERVFPLYSPDIDKIEIKSKTKFKRAKLYYVRDRAAREIRKKMKQTRFDPNLDKARQTTQPPQAEVSSK